MEWTYCACACRKRPSFFTCVSLPRSCPCTSLLPLLSLRCSSSFRSLGDFAYKSPQALLSAEPYVVSHQLEPSDHLVLLTSDGVTDVLPDDDMLGIGLTAIEQVGWGVMVRDARLRGGGSSSQGKKGALPCESGQNSSLAAAGRGFCGRPHCLLTSFAHQR